MLRYSITAHLLSVAFSITACNYQKVAIVSSSGKKHLYRAYNSYYKQEVYNERNVFRWKRPKMAFVRYSGVVESRTINGVPYVQTDTFRQRLAISNVKSFSPFFTSGLLYSTLFIQKSPINMSPVELYFAIDSAGRQHMPCEGNWCGYTLNIGLMEEPNYLRISPKCRRFKLWVMNNSGRTGYSNFFVEIRNEQVKTYVPIAEFVKEATVTFIASTGYHI